MSTSTNVHLQRRPLASINVEASWLSGDSEETIIMVIDRTTFFLNHDQAESIVKQLAFDMAALSND